MLVHKFNNKETKVEKWIQLQDKYIIQNTILIQQM